MVIPRMGNILKFPKALVLNRCPSAGSSYAADVTNSTGFPMIVPLRILDVVRPAGGPYQEALVLSRPDQHIA
jgi:hypothetical protein